MPFPLVCGTSHNSSQLESYGHVKLENPHESSRSTIKRTVQVGRSVSGRVQSGGAAPDGKIPFSLMTKGESFIRCRGQRHGFRGEQIYQMHRTKAWF